MKKEILTHEELTIINWQFEYHGDFLKALFEAICKANDNDLAKLYHEFPCEVSGYLKYKYMGGWWEETVEKAKRMGYLSEDGIE